MPDIIDVGQDNIDRYRYGYLSSQCNGVAFDASLTYAPPKKADGTSYGNADFTAAWNDGFAGGTTTNLNDRYYYKYKGTQTPLSWRFTTNGADSSTTFYKECMSREGNATYSSVFEKVILTTASADTDKQNYANWFSYYRTRRLLMRTAAGNAFQKIGSDYRVGFTTISNTGVTEGTGFLHARDFDQTQKNSFYEKLYGATGNSTTPLRGALSKVGAYYANKATGQSYDPVQYSCQRNYAILSTDGYWNTGSESDSYKALKLDRTTEVGQQDGDEVTPYYDGQVSRSTAKTTTTVTERRQTVTRNQAVTTTRRDRIVVAGSTGTLGCASNRYAVTTTPQSWSTTVVTETTKVADVATPTVHTVVTDNGKVVSDTNQTQASTETLVSTNTTTVSTTRNPAAANTWTDGTSSTACTRASNLPATAGTTTYNPNTTGTASGPVNTVLSTSTTVLSSSTVVGTTTTTNETVGGSSNSLADIAEYYYKTDLRSEDLNNCTGNGGRNVCANILSSVDRDTAEWQHMTTFTLGLGVDGTLAYQSNYETALTGDFAKIKDGTLNWPDPKTTTNSNTVTERIDDLWHAAVNGRGLYFATKNADSLSSALVKALTEVQKVTGASSGAATTSLKPIVGETNEAYIATFTTLDWSGDVKAYPLDAQTGVIDTSEGKAKWSAAAKLDAMALGSRKVYYRRPGSSPTLALFTYDSLSADGLGSYFSGFCSKVPTPAQCTTLTATGNAASLALANDGTNLVSYLRGDRTYEQINGSTLQLYRTRASRLGDIVNASPLYVKKPPFLYTDVGYSNYKNVTKANRKAMVYAASNDGMLHAFSADASDGGAELWAYVPSFVMPSLYRLADTAQRDNHQYFVDGAPIAADIQVGSTWKTILIGGLNKGGKGYYALDISDPENPQTLWEFSHADLGLTYGTPVVTKRADGTWIVVFGSGHNNTDGIGRMFVLNANTGALVSGAPYSTGVGAADNPAGLTNINAWIDTNSDNTAKRFYGGDLLGNIWRFDIDNLVAPNGQAQLLGQMVVGTKPQPVTTMVQPIQVTYGGSNYPVVIVATGRYLGETDLTDTTTQSIYGIKDTMTNSGWGDLRTSSLVVTQTITANTISNAADNANVTNNDVDWSTKAGWRVDLPHSGERVVVDPVVLGSTIAAATAIPTAADDCTPVGSSWLYQLSTLTGGSTDGKNNSIVGKEMGNFLIVGIQVIMTGSTSENSNDGTLKIIGVTSKGDTIPPQEFKQGGGGGTALRRTSWRELAD